MSEIDGRRKYRNLEDRLIFNSYLCEETGCWIWLGRLTFDGYPLINVRINGKHVAMRAHRLSYEELTGAKIPEGYESDHFDCHNTRCIHPNHTRPVPKRVNLANRRGYKSTYWTRGAPAVRA